MIGALADEHIVGALIQALRQRGMDVTTVEERKLCGTDDEILLMIAL